MATRPQNNLNNLRKKAADVKFEMDGLKKGTQEYIDKSKELKQVTSEMDALKKQIGITSFTLKELNAERAKLTAQRNNSIPLSAEFKEYDKQLQAVNARHKELTGGMQGVHSQADKLGEGFKDLGRQMLNYIGIVGLIEFFKGTFDAALEEDKALHRLQGTLDNLGRGDAFDRIIKKSQALEDRFKVFGHEDFISVYEKLITYGKLTENQMDSLIPVITNFASKAGKDLPEAASLILKAIGGNARALKEFGINLKDAKDESERFNLVMTALKDRVEGATDAFGESALGKLDAAKVKFKDLREEIGDKLIPTLITLLGYFNKILDNAGQLWDVFTFQAGYDPQGATKEIERRRVKGLTKEQKDVEGNKSLTGLINMGQDLMAPTPKGNEVLGKGLGLDDGTAAKNKAAQDKAKSEREASLKRAEQYHADGLKLLADANKAEAEELKAKYKAEADDQTKSLEERFAALKLYYEAGKKLIEQNKQDKQNEINDTEKREVAGAKTKTEKDQAIWKAAQATDALVKSSALDASNFEIEVSNEFTKAADQNFKKLTAESQKSYEAMKKHDADAYKNQQDIISIEYK